MSFLHFILVFIVNYVLSIDLDPNGYILYCPCMGRFGNQVDQFLGSLGFARGLNRTLVLPPWVEYRFGQAKSVQVPFDTYFQVETLELCHRVMTMEKFMSELAETVWPPEKRISFCYTSRGDTGCNAKEGNPFGPFWDTFNVDFVSSEFYSPLHYDTYHPDMALRWTRKYPPADFPVLAFTGAPGSFPVSLENRDLHKHLQWQPSIALAALKFIRSTLPRGAFIGIHLRNGVDWSRACQHVDNSPNLFAAPQCLGYRNERGKATVDMCLPSRETIIRQLKRTIKNTKDVRSLFVASDNNHMLQELSEALRRMDVSVFKLNETADNPHLELAILGRANHFIGNCISTFSAFVKRERDANGFPSSFWAFPTEKHLLHHEEL